MQYGLKTPCSYWHSLESVWGGWPEVEGPESVELGWVVVVVVVVVGGF